MELSERFWSASLPDLKAGYHYDPGTGAYHCLVCGESFEDGRIYPVGEALYEAKRMVRIHAEQTHGSMLSYLLGLDKKTTGLTDLQKELIEYFAAGVPDAEIVKRTGAGSASTIRNHRFSLKEKAKQAKVLLAVMELMDDKAGEGAQKFVPIHRTASRVDERYAITAEEYDALIRTYFPEGPEGRLDTFPRKEKRKVAVLKHLASFFAPRRRYTEKEINETLKRFYEQDYVTLRRYLVEYGFLDREADGSAYWLKD